MNATIHTPEDLLAQLAQPFHPSAIEWKPGTVKGERALALAYADLRAYMERLDEVCGLDWSVEYQPWGDSRIVARLTIGGVTRSSTGEPDATDQKNGMAGSVAEAMAFKRACAMFGLGRYLYNLPTVWADFDPATKQFTAQAKAKLTGILVQHYRRAMDGFQASAHTNGNGKAAVEAAGDTARMSDAEHDLVITWTKPDDAYAWAIGIGACDNVYNARQAFANVVTAHGDGRLTKQNAQDIYLAFIRDRQAKLQEASAVA